MILIALLNCICGLRLIYMPHINKVKNQFLMNKNGKIMFGNCRDDLSKMYTVIKSRKLYFLTDGSRYTFKYNPDKVSLRLVKKHESDDIEFYSWERSDEAEVKGPVKTNFEDINVKQNTDKNKNDEYDLNSGKNRPSFGKFTKLNRSGIEKNDENDGNSNGPIRTIKTTRTSRSNQNNNDNNNDSDNVSINNNKNTIKSPENKNTSVTTIHKIIHKASTDDIESDTNETIVSDIVDLTINTLNYSTKTFNLKKDNLCLTYFKDEFIMSGCNPTSDNQVFKIIDQQEAESRLVRKDISCNTAKFKEFINDLKEECKKPNPKTPTPGISFSITEEIPMTPKSKISNNSFTSRNSPRIPDHSNKKHLKPKEPETEGLSIEGAIENIDKLISTALEPGVGLE